MLADTEVLSLIIILLLESEKEFIFHLLPFFLLPHLSLHVGKGDVGNGNAETRDVGNGNLKISPE